MTVNNPEVRNALDTAAKRALAETIAEIGYNHRLRALVLTGTGGKSFISGTNLRQMADFDPAATEAAGTLTHEFCDALRRLPVPEIAKIQGYCLGSGMEISAACDLRLASEDSVFGMPEARVGIPSAMEACLLPQLIGWGKTRELVFTGERIDATEAARIGFLENVVPAEELDAALASWILIHRRCRPPGDPRPKGVDPRLGADDHRRGGRCRHPLIRRRLHHRRAKADDARVSRRAREAEEETREWRTVGVSCCHRSIRARCYAWT